MFIVEIILSNSLPIGLRGVMEQWAERVSDSNEETKWGFVQGRDMVTRLEPRLVMGVQELD